MAFALVGLGEVEARILQAGRIEHALLQEFRVGLAGGIGERLGEQVEAEIRIEDAGARREQQQRRARQAR